MVLPFASNSNNTNHGELPRMLSEEEQILLAIDQGVHEVNSLRILQGQRFLFMTEENTCFFIYLVT